MTGPTPILLILSDVFLSFFLCRFSLVYFSYAFLCYFFVTFFMSFTGISPPNSDYFCSSLLYTTCYTSSEYFLSCKCLLTGPPPLLCLGKPQKSEFLVARPLRPPYPLLVAGPLKNIYIFAAFLISLNFFLSFSLSLLF